MAGSVSKDFQVIERMCSSANSLPKGKIVGVEVSFQVTSNSTIERKATNAEDRRNHMRQEGHYVAYVLDGAGNFSRSAALTAICQSSDCTVAYSDKELDVLVEFIQGKLDDAIH